MATIWSVHSRRIEPINLSAKPFCQDEAGAMGLSQMPMARSLRATAGSVGPITVADHYDWLPVLATVLLQRPLAVTNRDVPAFLRAGRPRP